MLAAEVTSLLPSLSAGMPFGLPASSLSIVFDHLWQSTVFAVAAGLFALLLRRNAARVRYGLWLAASIKFLIPLELLTYLGSHVGVLHAGGSQVAAYAVFDVAGRPFEAEPVMVPAIALMAMVMLWACGAAIVIWRWGLQARLLGRALRSGQPLQEGREITAIERLDRAWAGRLPMVQMPVDLRMEPGVAGVWKPRLLWPEGLTARLSEEHLAAIMAHELAHVRRQDNLTAMIHMAVEAIFWFHPLVWWIERRLMDERERACDEAVLQAGGRPGAYAEALLEACRFCVEYRIEQPPLACVSGLGGAQLRTRVVRILRGCAWRRMDWRRGLLLASAAAAVIAMPLLFGEVSRTLALPLPAFPAPPPPPPPPPGSNAWKRMQQELAAARVMARTHTGAVAAEHAGERADGKRSPDRE